MRSNIDIDKRLLAEAQEAGKHRTKRETVNVALAEYVRRCKQEGLIGVFATFEYDAAYDYKSERAKRHRLPERVLLRRMIADPDEWFAEMDKIGGDPLFKAGRKQPNCR